MKARLIKDESGKFRILCPDGSISDCNNDKIFNFLSDFKNCDEFYGEEGAWKSEVTPEMALYPGNTYALITDDYNLIILDFAPFSQLLKDSFNRENYISAADYGKKHNRSAEIVKVFCREGRIPGAKLIGTTWIIPANAAYPVSPQNRRDDLSELHKNKKSKKKTP